MISQTATVIYRTPLIPPFEKQGGRPGAF